MRGKARLAGGLVRCGGGFEVGRERHLRVDDHVLAAGEAHHHVRPQPAVNDHLLVEVHVRRHARELDDPAQLQLAPPAARLRPLQRGDQRPCLLAELLRAVPRGLDLLRELGVRLGPGDVGLAQLPLDAGEGLAHRADELLDVEPLGELPVSEGGPLRRLALEQRRPLLGRAGTLGRGRGGGGEAVACEEVAEHDADRNPGEQGKGGHAS